YNTTSSVALAECRCPLMRGKRTATPHAPRWRINRSTTWDGRSGRGDARTALSRSLQDVNYLAAALFRGFRRRRAVGQRGQPFSPRSLSRRGLETIRLRAGRRALRDRGILTGRLIRKAGVMAIVVSGGGSSRETQSSSSCPLVNCVPC